MHSLGLAYHRRAMGSASVTGIAEDALCRWFFLDLAARPLLEELRVSSGSRVLFSSPTTSAFPDARGPGDIDVLIADPQYPEASLAIEVKRVKIQAATFHTGMPGKLQDLQRGVQQANLLADLGFHRTFLVVAVVVDGREREQLNFASRGPTFDLVEAIDNFPGRARLAPHVGLAFVEIVQPVDKPITDAGGIGVRVVRHSTAVQQPLSVTAAITRLLNARQGHGEASQETPHN